MRKGFTLIELLAVIVILAIITLIATPIILDVIKDTKEETLKRSSELYIKAVELTVAKSRLDNMDFTTCNKVEDGKLICGENKYEIEIQGEHPESMEVKIDQKGQIYFAMKNDGYCMIKTEDDKSINYKKIVTSVSNSEKQIKDNMCSLNPYTPSACFEFDISTGTITKYYTYENNDSTKPACPKDVVIPRKINGVEVKIIGDRVFNGYQLTSVEIPNTVITIEEYAFSGNLLKKLVIPEGVKKIENDVFSNCQIEELSLPSTLTSIGVGAFRGNQLPEEQAYIYKRNSDGSIDYSTVIGYGGELKDIVIPSEKNGVKLTTIGGNAFRALGLTSVKIPHTVIMIGIEAFFGNALKELVIPEGVQIIESYAFSICQIEKLSLPSTLTSISASAFHNNNLPEESAYIYKRNSDGSIDYSEIIAYGGNNGNDIVIPSEKKGIKLTSIGKWAFSSIGVKSVEIPNTVVTIGQGAFSYSAIKELVIPEGVQTIGVEAFWYGQIETLILPSTLTTINHRAFYGNSLTSVTIKNTSDKVSIGSQCFGTFDINQIKWEPIVE